MDIFFQAYLHWEESFSCMWNRPAKDAFRACCYRDCAERWHLCIQKERGFYQKIGMSKISLVTIFPNYVKMAYNFGMYLIALHGQVNIHPLVSAVCLLHLTSNRNDLLLMEPLHHNVCCVFQNWYTHCIFALPQCSDFVIITSEEESEFDCQRWLNIFQWQWTVEPDDNA